MQAAAGEIDAKFSSNSNEVILASRRLADASEAAAFAPVTSGRRHHTCSARELATSLAHPTQDGKYGSIPSANGPLWTGHGKRLIHEIAGIGHFLNGALGTSRLAATRADSLTRMPILGRDG